MPEIEFTLDQATGELAIQVKGVAGPACDDVARLARELLGKPSTERNSSEYYLRPRIQSQVRPERG